MRHVLQLSATISTRHSLQKKVVPATIVMKLKALQQFTKYVRIYTLNEFRELTVTTTEFHLHVHRAFEIKHSTLLRTIEKLDGIRKPEHYEKFLIACFADSRGRTGYENNHYPQADLFRRALEIISNIDIQAFRDAGLEDKDMANTIHTARESALKQ